MAKGVLVRSGGKGLKEAIKGVLEDLLRGPLRGLVLSVEEGDSVVPGLILEPEGLSRAKVLAPYMAINSARVLQMLSRLEGPPEPLGAVLRPCEARAAVELRKLKQVAEDGLYLIALDCLGTYPLEVFRRKVAEGLGEESPEEEEIRMACRTCLHPVAPWADLRIGFLGVEDGIFLEPSTQKGEELLREAGYTVVELELAARKDAIGALISRRRAEEERLLENQRKELRGYDALLREFAHCINCHNCMTVCPICYCRECFFNSPNMEFEAERYMALARGRQVLRLPTDILLFHLGRMSHMATSCVACGMCEEGCPQGIRVFELFKAVSKKVQGIFDYEPGRDPSEPLPLTTFREEELKEVEEPKL